MKNSPVREAGQIVLRVNTFPSIRSDLFCSARD
jgi:hypothetical protein